MFRKKIRLRDLLLIVALLFILIIISGNRNILLRKEFRKIQEPSYIFNSTEQTKLAQQITKDIIIVKNDKVGLWDKEKKKSTIHLVRELILGEKGGDPNLTFYQIWPIIPDNSGNIYVCSRFDRQIKKFSQKGDFLLSIGKEGKGPGEFLTPVDMRFDNKGILWVADLGNQRISKFNSDGKFLDSFQLEFIEPPRGFVITNNCFYMSFYDARLEKVVHKYNLDGSKLCSFGEPVIFRKPMKFIDMTVKRNTSGGPITLFNDEIYFSQRNPYEIRKYDTDGILKMRIFRNNSFMVPAKMEIAGNESYIYRIPVQSALIGIWQDKIVNWVTIPPHFSPKTRGVIDLYDLDGRLLTSLEITDRIFPTYMDEEGKIYGKSRDSEGIEKVVRYRLSF